MTMKADPILEELWKIKDGLARDAGYDTRRFFEKLREWEATHPHPGMAVSSAEELRQRLAEKEGPHAAEAAMTLKEKPPRED